MMLHSAPGAIIRTSFSKSKSLRSRAYSSIHSCSTCHLNTYTCPGHIGHIELPVPVYHVTFMDQMLRLLRGTCAYCNRLKLPRVEVNRFCCRLRLVRYGLLEKIKELEELRPQQKVPISSQVDGDGISEDAESEISEGEDTDQLIRKREGFVKKAIKESRGNTKTSASVDDKISAIAEERRDTVKEFLAAITKVKTCGNCHGSGLALHISGSLLTCYTTEFLQLIVRIGTARFFGNP